MWPELIGFRGEDAKKDILKKNIGLTVEIVDLEHTDDLTLEYQENRVQIFVDNEGRVEYAPQIG